MLVNYSQMTYVHWEREKWVQQRKLLHVLWNYPCSWGTNFRCFLVHKFTSSSTYIHLHYHRNYVPTKQENLGYPWTLTPTNKNDSPVYLQIYDTIDSAPLLTRCTSWWIFYTCHTAPDSCLQPSDGLVSAKQRQVRVKIQTFIHLEVEV